MSGEDIDLDALGAVAGETAAHLLEEAHEWMLAYCNVCGRPKPTAGESVLMGVFAVLKQREMHYEEKRMGRQRDVAVRDYEFLKWLIQKASPNLSKAEASEARSRIIEIAGV